MSDFRSLCRDLMHELQARLTDAEAEPACLARAKRLLSTEFDEIPMDCLGLPGDLINPLLRNNLHTVGLVLDKGEDGLTLLRGVGPIRARRIMGAIRSLEHRRGPVPLWLTSLAK